MEKEKLQHFSCNFLKITCNCHSYATFTTLKFSTIITIKRLRYKKVMHHQAMQMLYSHSNLSDGYDLMT